MKKEIIVTVEKIKGNCPVHKLGDRFKIKEGYILETETPICIHSLFSIMEFASILSRGTSPVELGSRSQSCIYISCPDPNEEYSTGGNVIFKLEVH